MGLGARRHAQGYAAPDAAAQAAPGAVCRPPPVRDPSVGSYGVVGSG